MTWVESRKKWRKRKVIGGKSRDIYGDTQDEVREKIKELERMADAGMVLDDATTLAQYTKQWFTVKTAGLKPKSAEVYAIAINNHIAPFFKNALVRDIRPLHIQQLMANVSGLSRSAQSKILFTMRQILSSAEENGLITKNPCAKISPGGKPAAKKVPLTSERQTEITSAVEGTRANLFVLLALYAGLRREEALGLLWGDIHLDGDDPYLDVRNTVTYDRSGKPTHSPVLKTAAASRTIPLPDVLSDALREAKKTAGSVLVIPAKTTGGPMSLSAFRRMWGLVVGYKQQEYDKDGKKKLDENGKPIKRFVPGAVDFHVEPHLLRHTYITELCASGLDIKKIQYLAGHEDVHMTLQIYTHVTQNTPKELGKVVRGVFVRGSNTGSGAATEV